MSILAALCLAACSKTGHSLVGYQTTPDVAWEEVDFARNVSSDDNRLTDFKVNTKERSIHGHFQFQQLRQAQHIVAVCLLLEVENVSFDNVESDYDMRYFTMPENDVCIPYIYNIASTMPDVRICLYVSAFPQWITESIDDADLYKEACFKYASKIVKGYERIGVHFDTVVVSDSCIGGCDKAEFIAELAKLDVETVVGDSLYRLAAADNSPEAAWISIREHLARKSPYVVVPFMACAEDSVSVQWKSSLLKHLQPLLNREVVYMDCEHEDPSIMVFGVDGTRRLVLLCNDGDSESAVGLDDDGGRVLHLAPHSLNSVLIDDNADNTQVQ